MKAHQTHLLPHSLVFGALTVAFCCPGEANAAGNEEIPPPQAVTVQDGLDEQLDAIGQAGAGLKAEVSERRGKKVRKQFRNEIVVMGSSSVRGMMGRVFMGNLVDSGFVARRVGKSASGLARLDYHDWIAELRNLPINKRTLAVMVYVGVNDPQGIWLRPDERNPPGNKWRHWNHSQWRDIYRGRVVELINALCMAGVPDVIMLTPADVRWRSLQARLVRIRRLQIQGARDSACGHAISSSGDSLFLFEDDERIRPRRLKDGYHMTNYGAQVVFDRIRPRLMRLLRRRQKVGSPLDDL